ncbi:hypothetical protein M404DRAFT_14277 [Pisolithus tinctorius Marx 270]|uniref:BZIP domain-containing protein n=1 Tax=Pisolithus tinctorius Marx 270 TaxID=870435 RepID=A0A0C3PI47_PISTI|nr:hypothetical protein M404DRAFT_14277 [Pisolithus tinctorius Marx 270]
MVPIGPSASTSKVPSTSSAMLWATPSKEWTIPAKPKPGRKPKKESLSNVPVIREEGDDSSGRRVQNRAAQRAFRERKQSQLAELQARLHSYEQGEIERNVALQNVAKKMKEENEQLRKENLILEEKIARLEQQLEEKVELDKKRPRGDSAAGPYDDSSNESQRKRAKAGDNPQTLPFATSSSAAVPSSLESTLQGTDFSSAREALSPHFPTPTPPADDGLTYAATTVSSTVDSFPCILCSPNAPCLCQEIAFQQATNGAPVSTSALESSPDKLNPPSILSSLSQPVPLDAAAHLSILDNLPPYQAPVPLRRKSGGSSTNPVFLVIPLPSSPSTTILRCSGDPDNCMACADDTFGKAFCEAISHSIASSAPCIDCPRRTNHSDKILVGECCGDVSKCGSCGIAPIISSANSSRHPETIPTDDAWRQLKSHPNVAFADLTLLAEVVARRSKCTGSRVVISPAPGSITPERVAGPQHDGSEAEDSQSILLTDPNERFHQEHGSPPRLVPQDVLIECGRRRMREVNADGVREALRLLDSKFAHARP